MTDEFSRFHPLVNLIFYAAVLGITMFQMQAVLIVISLICGGIYHFFLKKSHGLKYMGVLTAVFVLSACINPLFSHRGGTLLFYLFTGNPVTFESIVYGIAAAAILCAVLLWFSTFNVIVTEDKLLAGIGRVFPHTAMLITMIFRFVPKFTKQGKAVISAEKALNMQSESTKNKLWSRIKMQADIFSITTTWALENSVDTADSMKARGYGSGKRTSYNNYKIEARDIIVIIWILIMTFFVCTGIITGRAATYYYPYISMNNDYIVYITYASLCMTPVIINVWEDLRWRRLRSKI